MRYWGSKLKKPEKMQFCDIFYHKSGDKIYDNLLERCQRYFEKTRHGHVWGQISYKVTLVF